MTRKRRLTVGSRAFMAEVDAEIARREMAKPITVRSLTIDFEERTFRMDNGRRVGPIEYRAVVIPILSTEHPVWNELW